ncbi:MAG: hypothetical protein C5B51_14690 [Terriglobia bacterium]|nr:MAG: hypothetical protein C5B51_14690 [Terriglobia bacterium]
MTRQGPTRAAIYIRVSSDDQTKGYGPQYQREETLAAAVDRDGCVVKPQHILDDSKSGSTDDRPGWQKLLAYARQGEIDAVYFWKLDRMMRDEYYFYVNEKELTDLGVELRFATQDLKDPFNRAIQVAVAAEERRKIRERTYAGRTRAMRDGKWLGVPPYGYEKGPDLRLRIRESEARWVRRFFLWLVKEKLSMHKMAVRACEQRIPTRFDSRGTAKPRHGQYYWCQGTIKRILANDVYTGTAWFRKYRRLGSSKLSSPDLRPENEWIRISTPSIISSEVFETARTQLLKNSMESARRTKHEFLFAKRIQCGVCGKGLVANAQQHGRHKYYHGSYWTDHHCMACKTIPEARLDAAVWPAFLQFLQRPDALPGVTAKYRDRRLSKSSWGTDQRTVERAERDLRVAEQRLLDCEVEGFYAESVLAVKRRELTIRRRDLEQQKQNLMLKTRAEQQRRDAAGSAQAIYKIARDRLVRADYATKRRVYQLLVDRIVLTGTLAEVILKLPRGDRIPDAAEAIAAGIPRADSGVSLRRTSHVKCDAITEAPDEITATFTVSLGGIRDVAGRGKGR